MTFKLGKLPATHDSRDIQFKVIRQSGMLPTPPTRFGHGSLYRGDAWGMMGNGPDDTVAPGFQGAGDCVFAGAAHETMETNRLAGRHVRFTGANTISDYSALTGYRIGDDRTDQGTNVRDALKYRQQTGVIDANGVRHKIGAYVALTAGDWNELMQAVYVFAAVGIGIEFPDSAMEQFDHGEPWDVVTGATIEGGHYIPCLSGDTPVSLLSGEDVPIADLVGTEQWVYAVRDGMVVPAFATDIRQTGSKRPMLRLHLDNDEWIDCTEDHLIMLRDGSYSPAGLLARGASLMPLYRRKSNGAYHGMRGYEEVMDPATDDWIFTHWRVVDEAIGRRWGVVHHADFDKLNNAPDNLVRMTWGDHRAVHAATRDKLLAYAQSEDGRQRSRELMSASWDDPARRERHSEHLRTNEKLAAHRASGFFDRAAQSANGKKTGRTNIVHAHTDEAKAKRRDSWRHRFDTDPEFRAQVQERARRNGAKNHKVVAIERIGCGDVYDLAVPGLHNFAVGAGVFVHNCVGRSSLNVAGVITWARRQAMTRAFYETYCDEAFAIIFPEELRNGKTERGFDLAGLNAALEQL